MYKDNVPPRVYGTYLQCLRNHDFCACSFPLFSGEKSQNQDIGGLK